MTVSNVSTRSDDTRVSLATPGLPLLVIIVATVTILRLVALRMSPLELVFDEAQYWAWSRDLAFGYFTKPPLIAWAIAASTSVCGNSEACVRSLSPLCHAVTALILYVTALRLFDRRTAFWTGFSWITLPGVAVSSFLMTTDTLLLMFWSLALLALVLHRERPAWSLAILFGLALGFGLNAKYAMIYLPPLVLFAALADRKLRQSVRLGHVLVTLVIAALMIAPNILWNAGNDFVTAGHTGENIGWSAHSMNLVHGIEFFVAQFGVAGPVIFGAMILALLGFRKSGSPETDRLLLWLSWPVVILIVAQGFMASANANWGATAFPAGVILASAILVQPRYRTWLRIHAAISILATAGLLLFTVAGVTRTGTPIDKRLHMLWGWTETARNIEQVYRETDAARLVTVGRSLSASMIYALRDTGIPVYAYREIGRKPNDHFEMDRPWYPDGERDGTLVLGMSPERAEALGARQIAVIDAPNYLSGGGSMPVFSFDP